MATEMDLDPFEPMPKVHRKTADPTPAQPSGERVGEYNVEHQGEVMRGIVNALILLVLASPCLLGGLSAMSYGFLGSGLLFLPENKDREVVVAMTYILSAIGSFIVTCLMVGLMTSEDKLK